MALGALGSVEVGRDDALSEGSHRLCRDSAASSLIFASRFGQTSAFGSLTDAIKV